MNAARQLDTAGVEVPAPRQPEAVETAERERPLDRWRVSGRPAPVLTDFGPDWCTGNRGLCGQCRGACQHDLEHDRAIDEEERSR